MKQFVKIINRHTFFNSLQFLFIHVLVLLFTCVPYTFTTLTQSNLSNVPNGRIKISIHDLTRAVTVSFALCNIAETWTNITFAMWQSRAWNLAINPGNSSTMHGVRAVYRFSRFFFHFPRYQRSRGHSRLTRVQRALFSPKTNVHNTLSTIEINDPIIARNMPAFTDALNVFEHPPRIVMYLHGFVEICRA